MNSLIDVVDRERRRAALTTMMMMVECEMLHLCVDFVVMVDEKREESLATKSSFETDEDER